MPLPLELAKRYAPGRPCFIETGTYLGGGVNIAQEAGFIMVYTTEISEKANIRRVNKKTSNEGTYFYMSMDSAEFLRKFLPIPNLRDAVIWLDAHYCGKDSLGEGDDPIERELAAVSDLWVDKNWVVLIDDCAEREHHIRQLIETYFRTHGLDKIKYHMEGSIMIIENKCQGEHPCQQ